MVLIRKVALHRHHLFLARPRAATKKISQYLRLQVRSGPDGVYHQKKRTVSPFEEGEEREPTGSFPSRGGRPMVQQELGVFEQKKGSQDGGDLLNEDDCDSRYSVSPTTSLDVRIGRRDQTVTPRGTWRTPTSQSLPPSTTVTPSHVHLTPTVPGSHKRPISIASSPGSPNPEVIDFTEDNDWGNEAVFSWNGPDDGSLSEDMGHIGELGSASSVAASDAGVGVDDEDDDEDNWGREACLEWAWNPEDEAVSNETDTSEAGSNDESTRPVREATDQITKPEESVEEMIARGMPEYMTWAVPKLQVCVIIAARIPPILISHIEIRQIFRLSTQ